jgi:benzoyl-CoA reductase/2-hydroxyglutaryl-CoA dehydratase subunit BcrC/BadD/HgdB
MRHDSSVLQCVEAFKSIPEQSIAALDAVRGNGGIVAGVYCIYAPSELIRATGAVPVGLCGKKQAPIEAAERELPAAFCPLVKSSYGYAVTDTCPFFGLSDVLVAETTCDGKKKMYELMARLKPLHVMQLPHTQGGEEPRRYWEASLHALEEFLVANGAYPADEESLAREIALHNRMRAKLAAVLRLGADPRSPLGGLDLLAVQESKGFLVDIEGYVELLARLEAALESWLAGPDGAPHPGPRLLLTGVPVGKGSEKAVRIAEELGARVVCMENCSGVKALDIPVDEAMSPYEALAARYLAIPCSCMSPNPGRRKSLAELGRAFRVDGVVDLTWLGCHTYNAESRQVQRWVEEDLGLPLLHLETDYSDADAEQLRTRIEAYLELIR